VSLFLVERWNYLLFAIPAACDVIGTSMMNMGLVLTNASVYQMLRGIVVVFTAALASLALKRKHYPFHWTGVVNFSPSFFLSFFFCSLLFVLFSISRC